MRISCELANSAEVYPRCYVLENINLDTYAITGSDFDCLYKGKYEVQMVCCKVLRLPSDNSRHVSILRVSILQSSVS